MGKSKDLATGETRFVNTAGDTMTGNLGINETSPSGSLHVKGTSSTHGKIILEAGGSSGSANNNFMEFNKHDGTKLGELEVGESVTNGGSLVFKTTPSGGSATTRMTINHNGYVTMANQPKFKVRRNSSSVTLTGNNAKQNLVFNVKDFDIGNGYNTTTGKYTVPATGVYFFFLNPRFDGVTGSTYARGIIYKGASIPGSPWSDYGNVLSTIDGDSHSTNYDTLNVSGLLSCVAGDTIHFLGGGNVDSSITFQAESQAGGFMIG